VIVTSDPTSVMIVQFIDRLDLPSAIQYQLFPVVPSRYSMIDLAGDD